MEQLKERLNSSSKYLQSNDMRVIDVHEGYAKVEMIIDEQILNGHGFVHAAHCSLWAIRLPARQLRDRKRQRHAVRFPSITSNRASAES